MKKKITKDQILQACLQKQEELVKSFKKRVSEMTKDAYTHNHSASQRENRSTGKVEVLSTLKKELSFVQREMKYLTTLDPEKVNTKVEPGAVVITNVLDFYISVSSEKVKIGSNIIYGISTKAPIYKAMRGLQKGDTFSFNKKEYTIKDVY
jgi:transcription elongation GreA/GreB family factor